MTESTDFDRRLTSLLGAYADRAPVDVDPVAMTRAASGVTARVALRDRVASARPVAWIALTSLVVLTVFGVMLGTGGTSNPSIAPTTGPTAASVGITAPPFDGRVGFTGLPPAGSSPSLPEAGELVLRYESRSSGPEINLWLFADGRVIWWKERNSKTAGLIEQRLTAAGVQAVRDAAFAALPLQEGSEFFVDDAFFWADLTIADVARPVDLSLRGHTLGNRLGPHLKPEEIAALLGLDARLRDLSAWLPAQAWADASLRGYVPSRYLVCISSGGNVPRELSPEDFAATLQEFGIVGPAAEPAGCRSVSLADARRIIVLLASAGYLRLSRQAGPDFMSIYESPAASSTNVGISLDPMLPDGAARGPGD